MFLALSKENSSLISPRKSGCILRRNEGEEEDRTDDGRRIYLSSCNSRIRITFLDRFRLSYILVHCLVSFFFEAEKLKKAKERRRERKTRLGEKARERKAARYML